LQGIAIEISGMEHLRLFPNYVMLCR
jgi:hypothetical protein